VVVEAENAIKLRTKTKNDLEALIYSLRDKMADDPRIQKHSSKDEREAIVSASNKAEEWLDDNGYSATVPEFKEQIDALNTLLKPITDRIEEEKKRIEEERKRADAEELAKKLQEVLEKRAKLNETLAVNETSETNSTIPELEIPEFNTNELSESEIPEEAIAEPVEDEPQAPEEL
jgi:hypothetical protein